ncbi:MAG TPA: sodium:solute symporter family protein, partial [Acidiferrobacterales bacterium]|nr:sodium:solute symporter family protein [Acidiferrobacterales bacterium]
MATQTQSQFAQQLKKYYSVYTGGFIGFVILLAIAEQMGMTPKYIGYAFLFATIGLYAVIGIMSRTADVSEYYVAGRRVPAFFNGMATGADWMSAASFIGMAGGLYIQGYDGLAFIMGWTGGYVLVAVFLAPYLRKFGQFTIPDFLGERYGGNIVRSIGVFAAILCSFTYVVAQIYGVGLITSRFTGLEFQIGVFVGLAGILVCSFLGGMKAVTWTQVAQYVILIIAYMIPVVWLSVKHFNFPVPQLVYGHALQKVTEREKVLTVDPKEIEVRTIFKDKAAAADAKLKDPAVAYAADKAATEKKLADIKKDTKATPEAVAAAEKSLASFPKDVDEAKKQWTKDKGLAARAGPPRPHAEAFPGKDEAAKNTARLNFLALVLCLMVGTAALPHILMRYYTTPSVKEARDSVGWSLFFIFLLYFTAPALAVLAKYDVYHFLVGSSFSSLPAWVANWAKVDPTLLAIADINGDGIVQLAEIVLGQDIIVLATPEIAGLPYVISALVAAGGLAAALSTADGLLLTIANALSHDVYYKMLDPHASTKRRLAIAKGLLLVVAVIAAFVTSLKPGDILFLVGAAFSLAASSFFPALVLGIFWKRCNKWGAITGMVAGLGTCMYYMYMTYPFFGVKAPLWFGINPISAGIFGIPAGIAVMVAVSLLTKAPDKKIQEL